MSGKPHMKAKEKKAKKKAFIELLSGRLTTIESVCKKIGISRKMYYRWKEDDSKFSREVDKALFITREIGCDFAESQLFKKMGDEDFKSISLYLRHNDERYMGREHYLRKVEKDRERESWGIDVNDPCRAMLMRLDREDERRERKEGKKKEPTPEEKQEQEEQEKLAMEEWKRKQKKWDSS